MEMHQVRYFLAVAEHLNFTRAAESLRIAQPSLTRAIQKLEEELAGSLFRRERSNTHMTELGRVMHPHLAAAFAAAEAAKAEARNFHNHVRGTLTLGVCGITPAETLEPVLIAAKRDAGHFELNVEVGSAAAVKEGLLAGRFDGAILTFLSTQDQAADRLDLHPLATVGFVVAFPPDHRLSTCGEVTLDMLDGEAFVERSNGHYEEALTAAMAGRGLARVVVHRSNDEKWIARLVRLGPACAVLHETAARIEGLSFVALADLPFTQRVVFATVSGRRHSPALARLVRAVRSLRPATSPCAPHSS